MHLVKEAYAEEERRESPSSFEKETHGNYDTACGEFVTGVIDPAPMLQEFPEDYGDSQSDCKRCAATVNHD